MMDELIKKALAAQWDDVLDVLKSSSPHKYDEFFNVFVCDYHNGECPEDLRNWGMTDEQIELFKWLGSSECRIEYYNKMSDEEMTDEDWFDLKASAW